MPGATVPYEKRKKKRGRKGGSRKVNAVEVETRSETPIWVSRNCAIFTNSPNTVSAFLPADWPGCRYMTSWMADCQMPLKRGLALHIVLCHS